MKRIRAKHDNKDRIIYFSRGKQHRLYYRPVRSRQECWLFDIDDTKAPALFHFFRRNGLAIDDYSFSMTLGEIHSLRCVHNYRIQTVIERIPGQVDYAIRELMDYDDYPAV